MDNVARALGLTIKGDGTYNHTTTIAMVPCPITWITIPVVHQPITRPPVYDVLGVSDTGIWALVRFQVGANPLSIAPAVPFLKVPANIPTKWAGDA